MITIIVRVGYANAEFGLLVKETNATYFVRRLYVSGGSSIVQNANTVQRLDEKAREQIAERIAANRAAGIGGASRWEPSSERWSKNDNVYPVLETETEKLASLEALNARYRAMRDHVEQLERDQREAYKFEIEGIFAPLGESGRGPRSDEDGV